MTARTLTPSRKYLKKSYLTTGIVALALFFSAVVIGTLISLDPTVGIQALWWSLVAAVAVNALWGIPALLLIGPYFRSLRYEFHEDQVVMHVGVITRSVKYVPFRTVTNMTVKQGPFDRLFGIGSLEIQTAGISGTSEAEQHLVGLEDPQAVYDLAVQALSRFRGAMDPTTADVAEQDVLRLILDEVRGIRQSLSG